MSRLGLVGLVVGSLVASGCAAPPGATNPSVTAAIPGSNGGPGIGDVPLGSWTLTLTDEDLRAAGITDVGAVAENTGTFTFTIAPDGTWTVAQAASQPLRWPVFRGSYTVIGENRLEMRTTFPPDYAGEVVSIQLTEVAEGLAIEVLSPPDPLLRAQWESHVWAPSR